MSARSKSVWHVCAWRGCRKRFRPYGSSNVYCCHSHYSLARRRRPATRYCALAQCGRAFLVGGTDARGLRRPDAQQRFHTKGCAGVSRESRCLRHITVPRLRASPRAALASAIDGEGWVSRRDFIIEIGNTHYRWLQVLRNLAGNVGRIREDRAHRRRAHWKRLWRWRVSGANAYALLTQCMSALVVKRTRSEQFIRRYRADHRVARVL